jgi:hypothetical protein
MARLVHEDADVNFRLGHRQGPPCAATASGLRFCADGPKASSIEISTTRPPTAPASASRQDDADGLFLERYILGLSLRTPGLIRWGA